MPENPISSFNYIDPVTGRPATAANGADVPGTPGFVSSALSPDGSRTAAGDAFNAFRGYRGPEGGGFGGFVPEPGARTTGGGTVTAQQPGGIGRWLDPSEVTAEMMGPIDFSRSNAAAADLARQQAPQAQVNADPFGRNEDPTAANSVIRPTDTLASRSRLRTPGAAMMDNTADLFAPFMPGVSPAGQPGQNPAIPPVPNTGVQAFGGPPSVSMDGSGPQRGMGPASTGFQAIQTGSAQDPLVQAAQEKARGTASMAGGRNAPAPATAFGAPTQSNLLGNAPGHDAIPGTLPGQPPPPDGVVPGGRPITHDVDDFMQGVPGWGPSPGPRAPQTTGMGSGFRPIRPRPSAIPRMATGLFNRMRPIRPRQNTQAPGGAPMASPLAL